MINKIKNSYIFNDFLKYQKESFCWFIYIGLDNQLNNISGLNIICPIINIKIYSEESRKLPIDPLLFQGFNKYSILEIKIPIEIYFKKINEILIKKDALIIDLPIMNSYGSFMINGCERVIVSQIIRSSGIYFKNKKNLTNIYKNQISATLIPDYGSWIHFKLKQEEFNSNIVSIFIKINEYLNFLIAYFNKSAFFNNINSTLKLNQNYLNLFNKKNYSLGKFGRLKINDNLKLNLNFKNITYYDIQHIINKLELFSFYNLISDDIYHLKYKRIRFVGELLNNICNIGFKRILDDFIYEISEEYMEKKNIKIFLSNAVHSSINEFFTSSQLSQFLDQINPISYISHLRKISYFGPGGLKTEGIFFDIRDIHPSHYGKICIIETAEGKNVGLNLSLAITARINKLGFLESPFWRVINGKVINWGNPIYLTSELEDEYKIAPADTLINTQNYIEKDYITVRYKQNFINSLVSEIDFISITSLQTFSVAASLIPFFEHNDANRVLMGSNMQRQSVPLLFPQKAIVGTGLEYQIAINSGMSLIASTNGIVENVTSNRISVKNSLNQTVYYKLSKYVRSNQKTSLNQSPNIWKGEKIVKGQSITNGPAILDSELALGQNILVAYMPWNGYNFEDAILINERLVYEDIFSSIHIEIYSIKVNPNKIQPEKIMKIHDTLNKASIERLDNNGIIKIGTFVTSGDILVNKAIYISKEFQDPFVYLFNLLLYKKPLNIKDSSLTLPNGKSGRVIDIKVINQIRKFKNKKIYDIQSVSVIIAQIRKIEIGDKMAGRHGNKGIVSKIVSRYDMPFLPDGTAIDIVLNPLGVPSRMNVGQLYECLLGLAGDKLNKRFKILPFDETFGLQTSRILINKKLRLASIVNNESWLFNPYTPGKLVLLDGRTGLQFENPITVGVSYMLKLIHLAEDKIHSRSINTYKLDTQQPLRGKSNNGGQRFGEMEIWALEAFGAAFTLKELITIKSDDVYGRSKVIFNIRDNKNITKFDISESLKVLIQELKALGLDISLMAFNNFNIKDNYNFEYII
uniref:DNA-directed RNA polymerase subunit beta n=1 Tax=Nitzschia sp. IriIs04 TaxID=1444690 RepID=A0A0S3QPN7_9STRA|nr:RNA polymerase beta subunit [Nitzschia sp. IriIs04]BAT70264.1 RNA polymerase beta subunit [Nitzschia sp. IriIs04]